MLEKLLKGLKRSFVAKSLFVATALSACGEPGEEKNVVTPIVQKLSSTDMEGKVTFTDNQTGKQIQLTAQDSQTKKGIPGVKVTFTDGDKFNNFYLQKDNYNLSFQSFPSVSGTTPSGEKWQGLDGLELVKFMMGLNPSNYTNYTVWESKHEKDPKKVNAMEDYIKWSKGNFKYVRCMTKEQMKKSRDFTAEIISSVSGWKVISTAYGKVVKLDEWGLIDTLPDEVYHTYEPMNFTSPPLIIGAKKVSEIDGNGIDDDCDGKVDGKASVCTGLELFCDDFDGSSIDTSKWNVTASDDKVVLNNGVLEVTTNNAAIFESNQTYIIGDNTYVFEARAKLGSRKGIDLFLKLSNAQSGIGFIHDGDNSTFTYGLGDSSCQDSGIIGNEITKFQIYKFEATKNQVDFYVDGIKKGSINKCALANNSLKVHVNFQGTDNNSHQGFLDYIKISKK